MEVLHEFVYEAVFQPFTFQTQVLMYMYGCKTFASQKQLLITFMLNCSCFVSARPCRHGNHEPRGSHVH